MKNQKQLFTLLVCLFFLSFSSLLYGQKNEEYVFSQEKHSINYKTLTLGDRVYSIGSQGKCKFPALRRNTGETNARRFLSGSMHFSDIMLMPGQDSILLTCGYYGENGDVLPLEEGPRIVAFDLDLEVIFDVVLPLAENYSVDEDMELTINGDGQIVVEMGSELYWLAANGDFEMMQSYPDAAFVDVDQWNATTMLALTKDKLYWMTNDGVKTDSLATNQEAQDLWIGHGKIYVLTASDLAIIDWPNDVQNYDLSSQNISAKGLAGNEESLVVWGEDLLQGNSKIIQFQEQGLVVLEEVFFDEDQTEVIGLEVVGGELILSGLTLKDFEDFHFAYIKRTDLLAAPQFTAENLTFDNFVPLNKLDVIIDQHPSPMVETSYLYQAFPLVFELSVTNNGTDTLRSFSLFSNDQSIFECAEGRIVKYYENLAIPPGESYTVIDSHNIVFTPTSLPKVPPLNLAVFAPNEHFERNFSDNGYTPDFPVGLEDHRYHEKVKVDLSPNPTQDLTQLTFHGNEKIKNAQINLIDLQGKKIFSQSTDLEKGEKINLNTQDLPAGLYFLNILSSGQLTSKKLIIQR